MIDHLLASVLLRSGQIHVDGLLSPNDVDGGPLDPNDPNSIMAPNFTRNSNPKTQRTWTFKGCPIQVHWWPLWRCWKTKSQRHGGPRIRFLEPVRWLNPKTLLTLSKFRSNPLTFISDHFNPNRQITQSRSFWSGTVSYSGLGENSAESGSHVLSVLGPKMRRYSEIWKKETAQAN